MTTPLQIKNARLGRACVAVRLLPGTVSRFSGGYDRELLW
jgi:hypothetical protein